MRKKILFMVFVPLVFTSVFVSCSKDDDGNSNSDIVGTWRVVSQTGYFSRNGEKQPFDESILSESEKTLTFNANGTYNADGDLVKWTYKNDTLIIGKRVWKVLKLTSTELIMECLEKETNSEFYCKSTLKKKQL